MTSDGKFTYTWDAENRLLAAESLTNAPAASRVRTEWIYQPDGRWSQRVASAWNAFTLNYQPSTTNKFLWDDKVLLAVLDGNDEATQAYLRGSDLSGSMAGAGGVGGLLAVSAGTNGVHFAAFDGNGNVSALLSANSSTLTASYEYGPFGETLRANGPMAPVNSLRFSTQFADDVTGHLKYLYREYLPEIGKWPSRDPIFENGGVNLYSIVKNQAISQCDFLGYVTLGHGTPNTSIIEHYNYLTFIGRCSVGKYVDNIRIDYSGMMPLLASIGISTTTLSTSVSGWSSPANFGSPLTRNTVTANCLGAPVTIEVFMRTRLVNDIYLPFIFPSPCSPYTSIVTASQMVSIYVNGATVKYDCTCCLGW